MKVNRWTHTPIETRFALRVIVPSRPDECMTWNGSCDAKGYGKFWDGARHKSAHRFSYELHVGPIPDGLQLDHLCKNTACVRPDHLEPVTLQENIRRSNAHLSSAIKASRITHCPQGHPYDDENTSLQNGHRFCRACHRAREARRRASERPLCSIPHCIGKAMTRGWCHTHYTRWVRHGDPLTVLKVVTR